MPFSPASQELEIPSAVSANGGAIPICDAQILMAYPFFSLAKAPRLKPINYTSRRVMLRVEANNTQGMATIWDADILIWAASQIVYAQNTKQLSSHRIQTRPYDILKFLGRGRSKHSYDRLRNSLNRLKSASVTTSLGPDTVDGPCKFSWIDDWSEKKDHANRAAGMEIFLSDWFYKITSQPQSCLTLDRQYFKLTGGLERWLYLVARKHGGRQTNGWSFDLEHLHRKSGSLAPVAAFNRDVRHIARRGRLLDYQLFITRNEKGREQLTFLHLDCGYKASAFVPTTDGTIVSSARTRSCHGLARSHLTHWKKPTPDGPKFFSKRDSKSQRAGHSENLSVEKLSSEPNNLRPVKYISETARPLQRDRQKFLNELLSRKIIPLPGGAL